MKPIGKISDLPKRNEKSWEEINLCEIHSLLEEMFCYIMYWCEYV